MWINIIYTIRATTDFCRQSWTLPRFRRQGSSREDWAFPRWPIRLGYFCSKTEAGDPITSIGKLYNLESCIGWKSLYSSPLLDSTRTSARGGIAMPLTNDWAKTNPWGKSARMRESPKIHANVWDWFKICGQNTRQVARCGMGGWARQKQPVWSYAANNAYLNEETTRADGPQLEKH